MARTTHATRLGALALLVALGVHLAAARAAWPATSEPSVEAPAWELAERVVTWWHRSDVPDSELEMLDLVMNQRLVAWSHEWIGAAIAAAPPIDDALAEAGRRGRLLLWYVPALEGQHIILPHLLDRSMMLGPFADEDLSALVERSFVALKLPAGGELARRFGLVVPDAMQPAILVLAPDGHELWRIDRIATFQPEWFVQVLADVALTHADLVRPSEVALALEVRHADDPEDVATSLAVAEERMLAGDVDGARDALAGLAGDDAAGTLLRARLALRERRGEDALALARLAEARALDATGRARAIVLAGRALLGLGRNDEAVAALSVPDVRGETSAGKASSSESFDDADRAGRLAPDVAAEAGYRLGVALYLAHDDAGAVRTWRRCAAEHPASVWGARASACGEPASDGLLGETALVRSMTRVAWMDERVYGLRATGWQRDPDDWPEIARDALRFLLEQQRADGAWNGAHWGGGDEPPRDETQPLDDALVPQPAGTFGNIRTATAALGCLALRAWRDLDPEQVDAALRRGEAFLLRDDLVVRGDETAWVYADAFRVLWFARRHGELGAEHLPAVRASAQGWVDALVAQQADLDGAFRHYAGYKGTFVSACVAWCLLEGRAAGLSVADEVFERAADVLESARGPNGLFGYLVDFPQVGRTLAGAANRQPLCEWVLERCGRREPIHVRAALELFLEQLGGSAERARKGNFHVPELDQTAGYFFFHNFVPASLAARALGDDGVNPRARLLRELCKLPEIDGSFIDSGFSYGKSYSTAMALLSLDALVEHGGA